MTFARMVFVASVVALLLPGAVWAGAAATFEQAQAQADAQGKLLLVDFFTET